MNRLIKTGDLEAASARAPQRKGTRAIRALLVVETDGGQFHNHPRAFENDHRRDQILIAAGYRVMRITWRQLRDEPLAVVARLTMALAARAA